MGVKIFWTKTFWTKTLHRQLCRNLVVNPQIDTVFSLNLRRRKINTIKCFRKKVSQPKMAQFYAANNYHQDLFNNLSILKTFLWLRKFYRNIQNLQKSLELENVTWKFKKLQNLPKKFKIYRKVKNLQKTSKFTETFKIYRNVHIGLHNLQKS